MVRRLDNNDNSEVVMPMLRMEVVAGSVGCFGLVRVVGRAV